MTQKNKGKKKVRGGVQDPQVSQGVQDLEVQDLPMPEDLPLPRDTSRLRWQRTQVRNRTQNTTVTLQTPVLPTAPIEFTTMAMVIGEVVTTGY